MMNRPLATTQLNQTLTLLQRSFVQYLRYARPYVPPGQSDRQELIDDVIADQDLLVQRIREKLQTQGVAPSQSQFPMEFTSLHDLAIDYLLQQAVNYQQRDLQTLREISESLDLASASRKLVDEAAGMAQAHLESLQEAIDL